MNRRDAFKAIGAALTGAGVAGSQIKTPLTDGKPTYIIVKINGVASHKSMDRCYELATSKAKGFGWGDNFPVFVTDDTVDIEIGQPINVTIPPNTIVEQLEGYTVIYPVGRRPTNER